MLLQKPLHFSCPHFISLFAQVHTVIEQICTHWISLWINKEAVHVKIFCGERPGDLLQVPVDVLYHVIIDPFQPDRQYALHHDL